MEDQGGLVDDVQEVDQEHRVEGRVVETGLVGVVLLTPDVAVLAELGPGLLEHRLAQVGSDEVLHERGDRL